MQWRARLESDNLTNPNGHVILQLVSESISGKVAIAQSTIILRTIDEGSRFPEGSGILLPSNAILAIRDAIEEWSGAPKSNAEAENKILREALLVERLRVDKILGTLRPFQFH